MMKDDVRIFRSGDQDVWIPVSSRSPKGKARAFLPIRGMDGLYTHGYKADPEQAHYLDALVAIQRAFINDEKKVFVNKTSGKSESQSKCAWREDGSLVSPTQGWLPIRFTELTSITAEELIERLGKSVEKASSRLTRETFLREARGAKFIRVSTEVRTFQEEFRASAIELWGTKCAVTGATCLLEAAHIKSVSDCKENDPDGMTDPYNSIILNVAIHSLFDDGLVSFEEGGRLLISSNLGSHDRGVFSLNTPPVISFDKRAKPYLAHHLRHVFIP